MNTKLAVMACTTVLASSFMLFAGLHDVADANRRQAAARCIDSWHAWVRGTHSRIKYPDIEYCMLLSDVEPPEGMADRMRESDQWLREQEKRELHDRHEHEKKLSTWMNERDQAEDYIKGLCDEDDSGACQEAVVRLADTMP